MHNRNWFNKKWADQLDMPVPTTLDELYSVLKAFKEEDANGNGNPNDEIPLTGIQGASSYDGMILNALGINVRTVGYAITATADDKVYCANTVDAYKAYLKYMNKLYTEKILDNDFFVQTQEQLVAKAQQNIIGGCHMPAMYITAGVDIGYDYIQIDALTSALSQTKMVTASTGISIGHTTITYKNKYPEATLRLLDFFYTEDGGKVAYVGEESVGWYWIDKDKGIWDKMQPEGYNTAEDFRNSKATIQNGGWAGWERSEFNAGQGSTNAFWLNEMSFKDSYPYFVTEFPKSYLPLSIADSETVAKIEADVTAYIKEARARFISGEDDIDSLWSTYVTNLKNMGIDQVVSIYQKYYDEFVASMK
jgi:putative aldouronate transport system substrate-binding protein